MRAAVFLSSFFFVLFHNITFSASKTEAPHSVSSRVAELVLESKEEEPDYEVAKEELEEEPEGEENVSEERLVVKETTGKIGGRRNGGDRKLAAIGIRVSQWIAYHGLALNVTTDIAPFQQIVPCGIRDRQVGTIKRLVAEGEGKASLHNADTHQLINVTHRSLLKEFCEVFQVELCHKPVSRLEFL